jgi:hypothetical protein
LTKSNPENAKKLMDQADKLFAAKYDLLTKMAGMEIYQG